MTTESCSRPLWASAMATRWTLVDHGARYNVSIAAASQFQSLDFIYVPSRDVAAEVVHLVSVVGAEHVFSIEAFGARVAMVRLAAGPPALLLADHLDGERPVL